MHAYGRTQTGNLYGKQWLEFLDKTGRNVQLMKLQPEITAAIYQNQPINQGAGKVLIQYARNWIRTHAR